ncbi:MAG: hypothetical protein R3A51_17140 [Nannocystaceae bacterium]|nr:hypothetical protein [Myxococcales bacterium]
MRFALATLDGGDPPALDLGDGLRDGSFDAVRPIAAIGQAAGSKLVAKPPGISP